MVCEFLSTSTIDPHHDSEVVRSGRGGHPDIEVEAVLIHVSVRIPHLTALEAWECCVHILIARVGVFLGLDHSSPRTFGFWRTETAVSQWGLSKGDAQKSSYVALIRHQLADASNSTGTCLNNQVSLVLGEAEWDDESQEEDRGEEKNHSGLHLCMRIWSVYLKQMS